MKKLTALVLVLAMMFSLSVLSACSKEDPGGEAPTAAPAVAPTAAPAAEAGKPAPAAEVEEDVYQEISLGVYGTTWAGNVDAACLDSQTNSWGIYNLVYDCMFRADATGQIVSDVFESWEWSEDYLTLTCKLYDDITFANGEQMTGEDILYSVDRRQKSPLGGWYKCLDVANSTVSDDGLTVNLKYLYTYGVGIRKLNIYICDKSFVESLGEAPDWYDPANAMGSGPYKVTDYTKDYSVTFELREGYWGKDVCEADKITAYQYTDQTTMMIDAESGRLDIAIGTSEVDTGVAMGGGIKDVAGTVIPANDVVRLTLSDECPVLQDPAVREAICLAVDAEAMGQASYGSLGKPATSPYASGLIGYEGGHTYTYDPEKAKQILAAAGYKEGDVQLFFLSANTTELYAIAETLQAYLEAVGIKLTVEGGDAATVNGAIRADPLASDFIVNRQRDGIPDGEPWFSVYCYGDNYVFPQSAYQNDAKLQEYLDVMEFSLDEDARIAASKKIQAHLIENFICIPVCEFGTGMAYRTDTVVAPKIISDTATNLRYLDLV